VLEYVDMVLIMSVEPGFGGQSFIPDTIRKVRDLEAIRRERGLDFAIQVDGGINLDNVAELSAAGTDVFVAGVSVFRSGDIEAWVSKFFSLV
jgi:ribulose-phosphate 3-epimerase